MTAPDPSDELHPPPSDFLTELLKIIRARSVTIRTHLNGWDPQPGYWKNFTVWIQQLLTGQRNPVRLKNLEKVLAHLQMLQHILTAGRITEPIQACPLSGLLDQLKEPEKLNFNNAWEIADLLEAELLHLGDDSYIRGIWLTWPRSRVPDEIRDLVVKAAIDPTNDRSAEKLSGIVRPWLLEDQRDLVQEYRRDRAMINLRRAYLNLMAIVLLVLDIAFCWLFIAIQPATTNATQAVSGTPTPVSTQAITSGSTPAPTQVSSQAEGGSESVTSPTQNEPLTEAGATESALGKLGTTWKQLLLIVAAGAIGSVLARSTRLSQQSLPSEENKGKTNEVPLGIRSLMSGWSIFWAQIMLGATAALIIYLLFSSNLLKIEGVDLQTPLTLAMLSFIGGFSEPFLLNVVGKISGKVV